MTDMGAQVPARQERAIADRSPAAVLQTAADLARGLLATEFLIALSRDNEDRYRTIPLGIALFGGQYTTPYGTIFAASAVAMLPIALIVLVFGRAVVSGLTTGAVTG
jgi:ABC-type maltose transport system permease subunit